MVSFAHVTCQSRAERKVPSFQIFCRPNVLLNHVRKSGPFPFREPCFLFHTQGWAVGAAQQKVGKSIRAGRVDDAIPRFQGEDHRISCPLSVSQILESFKTGSVSKIRVRKLSQHHFHFLGVCHLRCISWTNALKLRTVRIGGTIKTEGIRSEMSCVMP